MELAGSFRSLDEAAIDSIASTVLATAGTCEPPRLLFDLRDANFIGSAVVELLVRATKQVRQRGGVVAICCLTPFCHDVVHVTRLDLLMPVFPTREVAVDAMSATPCP